MNTNDIRILAVEDDFVARKVLSMLLNQYELWVDLADTGAQVLEKVASTEYALILMDIGLPDMNGLDLSEEIQKKSKAPIVVLSAYSDERYCDRLKALGLEHILKPMTAEKCKMVLKKYLPEVNKK